MEENKELNVEEKPTEETNEETVETTEQKEEKSKTELLREISKEYGFNAFEPEEVKKQLSEFNEWKKSQLTERERKELELKQTKEELSKREALVREYEAKLQATSLGIAPDKLEDALVLAGNDPSRLEEVVKKYPIFKSAGDVTIGLSNDRTPPPSKDTEVEKYLEKYKNSRYYKK